jgi:hypothetical protein
MIFVCGLIIFVIVLFKQRSDNIAKATNHIWVQRIPQSGLEQNYRVPIEFIGGVYTCRIPDDNGKISDKSPIHVIGQPGEFDALYPPGKMKFVQTVMKKIIYYGDDMEPVSNFTDMPIISGQRIAALINGSNIAAADVIRQSQEDSGITPKKSSPVTLVMLIGVGLTLIASIVTAVLAYMANNDSAIRALSTLIKQALGLQ